MDKISVKKFKPADFLREERLAGAVMALTAAHFGLEVSDLKASTRGLKAHAIARQVAMYVCNTAFNWHFTHIGRAFGRDRSTVSHAVSTIEQMRDTPDFDALITRIEAAAACLCPQVPVKAVAA